MKKDKKQDSKRLKKGLALAAALLLFTMTILGAGMLSKAAFADQGDSAPSTYYTWVKLKTNEKLSDVIKKYGKAYGDDENSIALPIILIDQSSGFYFVSPGEDGANHGSDDGSAWKQGSVYTQNTGSYDYWTVRDSLMSTDGVGASVNGSPFVTGSLLNCWFVTNDSQTVTAKEDRSFTMSYQLHTWKKGRDSNGTTVLRMSDKLLNDSYATDTDDPVHAKLSKGSEAYNQDEGYEAGIYKTKALNSAGNSVKASCNWDFAVSGSGFNIRRYEIYYETTWSPMSPNYYYLYHHSLAGETSYSVGGASGQKLFIHVGLEEMANTQTSGFYTPIRAGYAKKSGSAESFEVWYAIEGVSLGLLDGVDGTTTNSASLTTEAMTMEVWNDNKIITGDMNNTVISGTSAASPVHSIIYIPKGNTLTIEENAVFIVGRNSALINNGRIVNNGTVIVEPGGILMDYESRSINADGSNVTAGIMTGSGNLYIRSGGKVRLAELSIEGNLLNEGFLAVACRYVSGRYVKVSSDLTYLTKESLAINYWFDATDRIKKIITDRPAQNPNAVVEIREATKFDMKDGYKIHYPGGRQISDVFDY